MEVAFADTFLPSLKNLVNSENPWHWRYYRSKWYDLKWIIWAKLKYRKIVREMTPWDYGSVLKMLKFQIEVLSHYIEHKGYEVPEDRLPKVKNMKRFIELANGKIEDDYTSRCGYKDGGKGFLGMLNDEELSEEDKKIEKHNTKVFKKAQKLEEKEWEEMFNLLKEMRSWWD